MSNASAITSGIMVNCEIVHISDNALHLGYNISTSDRDSMILAAKRAFWKSYNNFVSNFSHPFFVCGLENVVENVMACSSNDTL